MRVVSPSLLRDVFRAVQERPSGRASLAGSTSRAPPFLFPSRRGKAGSHPGEGSPTPEPPTTAAGPSWLGKGEAQPARG